MKEMQGLMEGKAKKYSSGIQGQRQKRKNGRKKP